MTDIPKTLLTQEALNKAVSAATQAEGTFAHRLFAGLDAANTVMNDVDGALQEQVNQELSKHNHLPWHQRPKFDHLRAEGAKAVGGAYALVSALGWAHALFQDTMGDHPIWGDGAQLHVLIFADNSFLQFEGWALQAADASGDTSFVLDYNDYKGLAVDIENEAAVVLSNTLDLDPEEESLLEAVRTSFHDADDPPLDESDEQTSWTSDDVAKAEDLAQKVFVYLAESSDAYLEFSLESIDEGDGVCVHNSELIDGDKFVEIMESLLDMTVFQGFTYEYNDGAYDRMSGYSRDGTVMWRELDLTAYSAHQIMDIKEEMRLTLEKRTVS